MGNKVSMTKTAIAAIAFTGLVGCASTSDLDELRTEVQQVSATANKAAADAAAAKTAAEAAQSSAEETNEKLDLTFKKSMYK